MIQKFKDKLLSDKNLKELLSGSLITFFLKISGMVLSFCVAIFISQNHGAEGVGIYNLSQRIIMSLSIVCALGFNISVLRYVGEFNVNANKGLYLKKIFKYFFELSLPTSLLAGTLIYLFSFDIATIVFDNENYDLAIQIIAVALPFFTLNLINVEFIRGLKLLKISEFLRSVSIYFLVLIILLLSILNFDILNPVYALLIGITVTFIVSVIFIVRHLNKLPLSIGKIGFSRKEFVKTSTPMMVISIASFILAFSGVFFLELFSSTDVVGIYSICIMLAQLVSIVLTVVNTISAPKFSELYWSDRQNELKKVIHHSSKMIFWASLFISIVLITFSKYILKLFGDEFIAGQSVLIILIFGQIINATTGSVGVFLNMTGNQKALRNIIVFTATLVILGYVLIIPSHGILGAAIISLLGTSILNIVSALYVYTRLNYVTFYIPFINIKK